VAEIFTGYGLTADEAVRVVDSLKQRPAAWCDFMMRLSWDWRNLIRRGRSRARQQLRCLM